MFYSHEILTNREHGIATIWLVATLGAKSSLKTLTRRKIQDVDVHRACDTIRNPEAPMALRLQGNLLYGVSRVHSQQCDYILTDAQVMRDRVRGSTLVLKELALDSEVARSRPDQLNLPDDPGFAANFDLTIDLSAFDPGGDMMPSGRSSLMSPPSLVSSRSSQHSVEEREHGLEEASLILPSENAASGMGLMSHGQALDAEPSLSILGDESGIMDVGWEFDEHGNMVETGGKAKPPPSLPLARQLSTMRLTPDSAISARVRQDHAEGLLEAQRANEAAITFEDGMVGFDEGDLIQAEARPFSSRHQADNADVTQPPRSTSSSQPVEGTSASTALSAPQRRAPAPKLIQPDANTGLSNSQLRQWDESYRDHMSVAVAAKLPYKSAQQAKKNAEHWVLGRGLGQVFQGFGNHNVSTPLQAFCGDNLLAALLGPQAFSKGRKRARSPSASSGMESEERNVRNRSSVGEQTKFSTPERELQAAVQGGEADGIFTGGEGAMQIEVGRKGGDDLPEGPSSQMPWDIYSASRHGSALALSRHTPGLISSVGQPGRGFELGPGPWSHSAISQRASRLTSASPLQGHGSILPLSHRISIISSLPDQEQQEWEQGQGEDQFGISGELPDLDDDEERLLGAESLEHGAAERPTAAAATERKRKERQAAAIKNKLAAASLDSETRNFLDYLDARMQVSHDPTTTPASMATQDLSVTVAHPRFAMTSKSTFENLIPPSEHNSAVAAQAFLHVLTLASKSLIYVRQLDSRVDGEDWEKDGEEDGRGSALGDIEIELAVGI